jgi:hypothetical protein
MAYLQVKANIESTITGGTVSVVCFRNGMDDLPYDMDDLSIKADMIKYILDNEDNADVVTQMKSETTDNYTHAGEGTEMFTGTIMHESESIESGTSLFDASNIDVQHYTYILTKNGISKNAINVFSTYVSPPVSPPVYEIKIYMTETSDHINHNIWKSLFLYRTSHHAPDLSSGLDLTQRIQYTPTYILPNTKLHSTYNDVSLFDAWNDSWRRNFNGVQMMSLLDINLNTLIATIQTNEPVLSMTVTSYRIKYLFGFRADYYKDNVWLQSESVTKTSDSASQSKTDLGESIDVGAFKNVIFTTHN